MVIKTYYIPATDAEGSKIRATVRGGSREQLTMGYPHGSLDPHKAVAWELAKRVNPSALRLVEFIGLMHKTGYLFKVEV